MRLIDTRYVRLLDRVRPEMMSAEHWLKNCSGETVMTEEAISAFNRSLHMCMPFSDTLSFSLDDAPDTIGGSTLRKMISLYVPPKDPSTRFLNGEPTDAAFWENVLDNRAMDRIEDSVPVRFGYSVSRGMICMFPTPHYLGEDAEDRFFDMNTASECLPYLPLVILHESRDGEWLFCLFYNIGGWVKKEHVAACRDRADWQSRRDETSFLTVVGRELRLGDDPYCESLSGQVLPMGTHLKLLAAKDAPELVHGRSTYGNYVTLLPTRGSDGQIQDTYCLIPISDDVVPGLLPYTGENVIRLAFKRLGDRYGWGGALHANDCSGIVHEIFTCFGFLLPRGAKSESDVPCDGRQDVSGLSVSQKMERLKELMPGSLLYLPGHIVIYLGMDHGEPYAISATGSMGLDGMKTGEVKKILSVCVNDLSVRRRTGLTWLESMTVFLTLR